VYQIATVVLLQMKIKTLVVAPYQGLAELTSSLTGELADFDVTVIQGDLSESLDKIRHYEEQGYDIIISRGGTAKLVREHCSLPVVEIKVSGYDILRLITLLKEYKAKIEMIGFPNIIEAVVAVSRLLDVEIPHTVIQREEEVGRALEEAKKKGSLVIVGDTITVRLAKEHGLQGILITSGKESVLEAFEIAKQTYRSVNRYKTKFELLDEMANGIETGIAAVDGEGELRYANKAFYRMLNIDSEGTADRRLKNRFPRLAELLQKAEKHSEKEGSFEIFDHTFTHKISITKIQKHQQERLYGLYVRPVNENENDVHVRYLERFVGTFPQLIRARKEFQEAITKAVESLQKYEPVTVYGERGTGKRILAGAIRNKLEIKDGNLFEVSLTSGSDEAFARLTQILEDANPEFLYYVSGVERLRLKLQRKLADTFRNCRARLIVSFEKPPQQLNEDGLLDSKLLDYLGKTVISMKPLRENVQELEELIRIFISENNEKYGKQIVGIRPKVLEALYAHPWKGNLIELRDTIREFVKKSQGEYIEDDVLPLLENKKTPTEHHAGGAQTLNLDQTLQEIQKDIIRIVLQEENMNQSRAAKRLGINRSTLWRMMKQDG
jgi:transcriptional regulator with PAS, ATPase and Fis domain